MLTLSVIFDNWPKIPLRNITLKSYFFSAINIVKNIDKEKYVHSGYGIAFDGKGEWNYFGNDFARNIKTFGIDIVHRFILIIENIIS